jgi:Xaa-Pro aminopeptidase
MSVARLGIDESNCRGEGVMSEKQENKPEVNRPAPRFPDFPYSEWNGRVDNAKRLMREQGIDLLLLWNDRNVRYFGAYTSTHWATPSIPPLLVLIPVDDEPVAITGEFFLSTAEAQTWINDIRTISEGYAYSEKMLREIPIEVAAIVRDIGYSKANIALEMGQLGNMYIHCPLNDIQTLINELSSANFVDGDKVIWGCRQIKSALEIDRLVKAAAIHRLAFSTVVQEFRPGMTEADVGNLFICSAFQNGAETVTTGSIKCGSDKEGMIDTKHSFDGVAIHKNDYLGLDPCVCYKGYWADMGRVINVGPITEDFERYSNQLIDAFEEIVQGIKPGITVGELQQLVCASLGLETTGETAGHGIGLDIHEPPFICAGSDVVLKPGMTLEVEPYLSRGSRKQGGQGYFHYENLIIITEQGCAAVYSLPAEILQVAHPFD